MMPVEDQFSGRRYINLESYRKNGEPKKTPVQSIEDNGIIYVRTDPKTWKARRIMGNPRVRIVVSDRNGKPLGSWVEGEARVIDGEERKRIQSLFRKEYGTIGNLIVNFVARLREERLTAVIAIKLQPGLHSSAE
jgi:uncharacterized protein